ncbi:uncharacterized protein J4E87_003791 [Alternaria ethzedia]|uniref:uncharacterized protein n=1 Tax=Alternaria ethzedia TaxID=181014 RepID=UPI0020C380F2|nr:uncharacterized protein J4E87_003791 [Alternaria ethzedia]KAI4629527.1 hypothetical protein J4E87_003791 [Alternaria ethzedia]
MAPSVPTTGAGVLLAFLKPTSTGSNEAQSDDKLALLSTAITGNVLGIKTATQYKAANAEYDKQHLFVCETEDLARVNVKQMLKFLDGEHVGGEWDVRAYSDVQIFGPGKSGGMSAHYTLTRDGDERRQSLTFNVVEPATTIMVALMQPSPTGAEDLDAWYREEHNQQTSEQPGWLRTCRYSLIEQGSGSSDEDGKKQELSFLAIHEFGEGEQLGDTVKAFEPISEWTMKVMKDAVGIDAAIYRRG